MTIYSQYNPDTGEIIALLDCNKEIAELNKPYIEGKYDNTYIIKEGKPIKKEDSVILTEKKVQATLDNRIKRDGLLQDSDHKVLPDYPTSKLEEWKTYRQALRDLPANTSDPLDVTWPTPPE